MYLVGAGVEDTGEYTCTIPGVGVNPALLTLYITQGREQLTLGVTFTPGVCISAVSISVVCHGTIFGIYSWEHIWYIFKFMKSPLIDISVSRFHAEISQSYMTDVISKML